MESVGQRSLQGFSHGLERESVDVGKSFHSAQTTRYVNILVELFDRALPMSLFEFGTQRVNAVLEAQGEIAGYTVKFPLAVG